MGSSSLDWQDGQPYSRRYGDIYFSRESGIAETHHVFLEQNRLAQRWTSLNALEQFVIGETGFGTGLNFLCAWRLWDQVAPSTATLHFVSTELHPVLPEELHRALELWPELAEYASQLSSQYGDLSPGVHRMVFAQGKVILTLLIGAASDTLPGLDAPINAWFLDGFAPSRNPQMWSETIFQAMAKCSVTGTTFATFTSAGAVRRGLEAVGFNTEKVPGYGRKREILRGEFAGHACEKLASPIREAIVIGGGLAGSATAHSLARKGWRITLIERHPHIAAEASGNHQGVLYARLSPKMSLLSEFTLAGYRHALRSLHGLLPQGENSWRQCGLLQLAFDDTEAARLRGVLDLGLQAELFYGVDPVQASALAGVQLAFGGLYFPGGGWVHPPALCRALTSASDIALRTGQEATELLHYGDVWEVRNQGKLLAQAPVVVVACAAHTRRFAQTAHLPLRSIRGQITHLPANARSTVLTTVLCSEGYAAPARQGIHTVGATYGNLEESLELRATDHAENLFMLSQLSPDLYGVLGGNALQASEMDGRAACRCNVPDYLPLVGSVSPDMPGLYVNTGHGSRGLITAMLAAEILAAELEGEPAPLPFKLMAAISPRRFK
jgi:tRNA 5-methylaminomethyl-2-thiouridine biosynthesis bifunctional protein